MENDYDSFAEAYAAENESSLVNAYYTRPAILDLLGDVRGRRVLDAGCGAGSVASGLVERGAVVSGFDRSAKMVELARRRLGDGVDLEVADIAEPLPYPDAVFDDAVAALVLHYLEDWTTPLAELRRVLKPGGRLVVVVNHPSLLKLEHRDADYFAVSKWSYDYTFAGQPATLTYWHRPLHAMTDAFTAAGFRTTVISEPRPAPEAHDLFPDEMARFPSGAFLCFLFFVLEAA
ncbi:class I SAM-dependent methyltransferase [Saccharothrix variisporea]|uniref:Methyltransferase family protein n=1 Tax=Saccharothrix variisporea TaxID=543527 RepID=A0A495XHZ2_9PSEU|nr:class I SAM-dependent methyltransferase [Saccharothrix variisporea]RKT73980.1 methyltransferase family protein [Saccharothrix variisporea]